MISNIIFILSNIIIFFKLLLLIFIKLFFVPFIARLFLILLLLLVFYFLWKYPKKRFFKLSLLRNYKFNLVMKYKINNKIQFLYSLLISFVILLSSIILIFLLRYSNKEKDINLIEKYILIKDIIKNSSLVDIILNSVIFVLIFILYIALIIKLTKYLKYHVIKLHLYFMPKSGLENWGTWYQEILFFKILNKINIYRRILYLTLFIDDVYEKYYYNKKNKKLPDNYDLLSYEEKRNYDLQWPICPRYFTCIYKIDIIVLHLITKWHYLLIISLLLYDIWFNDYTIHLVFKILPWTLFYDLYIRFSNFLNNLCLQSDSLFKTVLYADSIAIWDKDTLIIEGDFYDYNEIKKVYKNYVEKGFIKNYKD